MAAPYPESVEELFRGLDARRTEADLRSELRDRMQREEAPVTRVGDPVLVEAVCARLVPSAVVPPAALASFVDDVFDEQLGRGDEQTGLLPRARLIPAGFEALEAASLVAHRHRFAEIDPAAQDALLTRVERGEVAAGDGVEMSTWFRRLRELVLLGYATDPRGMVEMGFPGPSYEPGHVWLTERQVRSRAMRRPGYLQL